MSSVDSLEEVLIGPKNMSYIAVMGAEWFSRKLRLDVPVTRLKNVIKVLTLNIPSYIAPPTRAVKRCGMEVGIRKVDK